MTTRDRERWREIVAELERWYVGPDVVDPGRSLKHVGEWRDILNEACKRIAELEAERDLLRRIAVHTVNETDGFASEHATIGFLCGLPAEVAAIKRERDALRAEEQRLEYINVVFDGPPSHESGRFIETEDIAGASVNCGEWIDLEDGCWALRILVANVSRGAATSMQADVDRLRAQIGGDES